MNDPTPTEKMRMESPHTSPLVPEACISACCAGDRQAWSLFVERCAPYVLAMARRTRGRTTSLDVDDAVQEVFLRLCIRDFKLLRSFDSRRASLKTWLRVVTHSTTVDLLRKLKPVVPFTEGLEPEGDVPSWHDLPDIPLESLTDRQRLIIRLLFQAQMTVPQVADLLEIDEQTVRSTKHKALNRLRDTIRHDEKKAESPRQRKDAGDERTHEAV